MKNSGTVKKHIKNGLIKKKNSFQKRLLYNEQKCPNHGNYMHIQQRDQTNRFMKTKKDAAAMKFR